MRRACLAVLAALASAVSPAAPAPAEMDPRLAPLRPLVGKTWRAVLSKSGSEKATVDVQRWELTLNGHAVRILHSIDDGEYGGESIVIWDKERQSLAFWYFTTGGFYTTGTVAVEDGAVVTNEVVKGDADGVTEVKAVHRVLPDGRLWVKTRFLKAGRWHEAREAHYVEDPKAEVRFK